MADGGQQLPPNEELFEQHQSQEEPMDIGGDALAHQSQQAYHDVPHTSGAGHVVEPEGAVMERQGYQMDSQQQHQQSYYQPRMPNRSELFMPAEYVEPEGEGDGQHFVMDQESGAVPPVNLENADATVWVDSSDDQDPEEHILRNNFWLHYSDHNYDPPNKEDRRDHPVEGPFPIIGGLDEEGNITSQWMPDGYGPPYRPGSEEEQRAAAEEAAQQGQAVQQSPQVQEHLQQQQGQHALHLQQQQQQYHQGAQIHMQQPNNNIAPMRQSMNSRPMVAAQPFSIGGNQVEYIDAPPQPPQRPQQRGHMVAPHQQGLQTQFRIANANEYSPQGVRLQRGVPSTATIIRPGAPREEQLYQASPAATGSASRMVSVSRGGQVVSQGQQPTPGSYQHIGGPTPAGMAPIRRFPSAMRQPERGGVAQAIVTGPSIMRQPPQQQGTSRPVGVVGPHHTPPVDYDTPQVPRRVPDVAPHRMTLSQRQEQQQQMARQRAQGGLLPIRSSIGGAQGTRATMIAGRGRVMGIPMTAAPEDQQQLLRSPQRPQGQQPVIEHQHRKFQLKPLPTQQVQQSDHTSNYTHPVAKDNSDNQLPAQLTEDPDEQPVRRTSESIQKGPEESAAAPGETSEGGVPATSGDVPQQAAEESIKQLHKSPARLPSSASSSPVKHHVGAGIHLKPTPPHRMTQEEKNAHFAKLSTDKDRPTPLQAPASSSASATPTHAGAPGASPAHHPQQQRQQPPHALPQRHHQDDTLAVVQSVFESNQPRLPDTPKDKEAISKIADQLRFSADAFTGASGSSPATDRHRTTSGGHHSRAQNYQMLQQMGAPHQNLQHRSNMDQMAEEARRKRNLSGGATRYDGQIPNQMPGAQQQQHHHPVAEEQHRPRGRPRGSTVAARWPDGQEPIAPHRTAQGARTLPPRGEAAAASRQQQQQPAAAAGRNGVQKDSDSESDGVRDSESWAMRCHCGMEHGDGETVECEECKTWQHMACMGLTPKSDTDDYMCELCRPRKLPVTRSDARRMQREVLKRLQAVTEAEERAKKQKSRKSEPAESKKSKDQQPSASRRSVPMAIQPLASQSSSSRTLLQLNTYSKSAAQLLLSMPQTAGADTLLEDSRKRARAKRMFIADQVEALVTTEVVSIRQVVVEVNGYVSMAAEIKRQPGGANGSFMYDGLMKGTTGEDVGERQELVCIDTKKKNNVNDSQVTRRSCMPNCVLKHVLGSQATLGIMVVATKDINRATEVTLPFDADWRLCEVPLQCTDHAADMKMCSFEQERLRHHMTRIREREQLEKTRREEEERRRLADEVRREREARTRQMDEEQERLEREQKQKEKEEAKKKREEEKQKREAEKAAEMEKKSKDEEAAGPSDKAKKDAAKDDKKVNKEKEKSASPEDVYEQSTSEAATRRSGRARKERNLEIVETASTPTSSTSSALPATPVDVIKNAKRKGTATAVASTSSVKRQRQTSERDAGAGSSSSATVGNRKRGAAAAAVVAGPSAKKTKVQETAQTPFKFNDLRTKIRTMPMNLPNQTEFTPEIDIRNQRERSAWLTEMEQKFGKLYAGMSASAPIPPPESVPSSSEAGSSSSKKTEAPASAVQRERSGSRKRAESEKRKEEPPKAVEKPVEKKKEAKKEEKKVVAAKAPEDMAGPAPPPTPRTPRSSAPAAPSTPKSTPKAPEVSKPIAKGPETPKSAAKAPEPPKTAAKAPEVAAPKKETPKSADETSPSTTEGSVEKEMPSTSSAAPAPPAKVGKGKTLSIEDYKARRSAAPSGGTTPSSATPAGARRGFIPSTEGLKDVKLSAIPLDDHPAGKNTATTTTAPSAPAPSAAALAPPGLVDPRIASSPSSRATRGRPAPSESSEEPAAHQMSLSDRIRNMFGGGGASSAPSTSSAPSSSAAAPNGRNSTASTSSPHGSRKSARPTRWNQ